MKGTPSVPSVISLLQYYHSVLQLNPARTYRKAGRQPGFFLWKLAPEERGYRQVWPMSQWMAYMAFVFTGGRLNSSRMT